MSLDPEKLDPEWQWWARKLAGKLPAGATIDTPMCGFFRKTGKEHYGARKTFTPVAFYPGEDGFLHCREGDREVDATRAMELWNSVNQHPVSEEAYRDVAQHGKLWPDEHELVPMQKSMIGHNRPPPDNDPTTLEGKITPLAASAEKRLAEGVIQDQDEANRIANLADALAELWKLADGARKAERKPHDDALKGIQSKWSPILLKAEVYKNLKYKLITPWQLAQDKAQKEEAQAAAAAGQPIETPRRPRAGTRGRAMTLKPLKTAKITDFDACLNFFKDHEELRACVQLLASRAIRAGATVPGAELEEEMRTV